MIAITGKHLFAAPYRIPRPLHPRSIASKGIRPARPLSTSSHRRNQPDPSPSLAPSRPSTALDLPPLVQDAPATPPAPTYEPLPRALSPTKALLLLHIPLPPTAWPARLEMASSLLSTATRRLKPYGISVNAIWDGVGTASSFSDSGEKYHARLLFPHSRVVDIPDFTEQDLSVDGEIRGLSLLVEGSQAGEGRGGLEKVGQAESSDRAEVLVCTHGSRDCRCSDRGGGLVSALKEEIERRGLGGRVRVGEIAHVGGHKYAANALTLPYLNMFSNLAATDAPMLIDHLISQRDVHRVIDQRVRDQMIGTGDASSQIGSGAIWSHWRGRYGLTEAQQAEMWRLVNPDEQSSPAGDVASEGVTKEKGPVKFRFKTWEGEMREVEAKMGETLLQVAKANALPSIEGTCGGNLECATCHLYIPDKLPLQTSSPGGTTSPAPAPIPEPSEAELDMLGYAVGYRDGQSRLGCQIKVDEALRGWVDSGGVIGLPRF